MAQWDSDSVKCRTTSTTTIANTQRSTHTTTRARYHATCRSWTPARARRTSSAPNAVSADAARDQYPLARARLFTRRVGRSCVRSCVRECPVPRAVCNVAPRGARLFSRASSGPPLSDATPALLLHLHSLEHSSSRAPSGDVWPALWIATSVVAVQAAVLSCLSASEWRSVRCPCVYPCVRRSFGALRSGDLKRGDRPVNRRAPECLTTQREVRAR